MTEIWKYRPGREQKHEEPNRLENSWAACLDRMAPGLLSGRREKMVTEERDTKTITEMFAEALGCLEDALCYLGRINEQYDPEQHDDEVCPSYNPALDFWLQTEQEEELLKDILNRLQRVEPLAPKGAESQKEGA